MRGHAPLAGLAALSASAVAHAGGGAPVDAYEGVREGAPVDVHALADVYVEHGAEHGPGVRAFDTHTDALALGFLRVTAAHAPAGDALGFRVDAGVGDTANAYLDADAASADARGLSRALSYVQQGFVTVVVPRAAAAIDVGKFDTPIGFEDNVTPQNWSYSRSLLFTLAEPTYHVGARATFPLAKELALAVFWLNGWNANVEDGSGMRTFASAMSWSPCRALQLAFASIGGLERSAVRPTAPGLALRAVASGNAVLSPLEHLSLALTADDGADARGGGFWGLAGYAHVEALRWLALTARAEEYRDPNGVTTGTRQAIGEATATVELGAAPLRFRLEARRDRSDLLGIRDTATIAAIATF